MLFRQFDFRKSRLIVAAIQRMVAKAELIHGSAFRIRKSFMTLFAKARNLFKSPLWRITHKTTTGKAAPPYLVRVISNELKHRMITRDDYTSFWEIIV